MPQASIDERIRVRLVADQDRVQEGARRILESDIQSASESLAESASFEDLVAWNAILAFWLEDTHGGLMAAISKVVYAPDAKRIGAPRPKKGS
ncbi:MAG: hypothetical protein ACR2JB_19065 [Bryobacteraceae bacterium]